jgi:RNA polymerase sigma factor (sigma-70 family)
MTDGNRNRAPAATGSLPAQSPSREEAYGRYRPLLLSALAKLATRGFATIPDDGMDLIQDFFVDAWGPVVARYDSRQAKFETYLYACFVNYARPRIIRLSRWRQMLMPPDALAEAASGDLRSVTEDETLPDRTLIRHAVSALPPVERDILAAYVSGDAGSERQLAARFGLTRYRLRLSLSNALGRLAVALNERGSFGNREWAVLAELWHNARTVRETAGVLRLPVSDVQAMRTRWFARLAAAVGTREAPRRSTMETKSPTAEELLERALRPDAREDDISALRRDADRVLAFLEQPAAEALLARHAELLVPEKVADIYRALAHDESFDPAEDAHLQAFLHASEEDEEHVGRAFALALIPSLPRDMMQFADSVFYECSPIDEAQYRLLSDEISVKTAVKNGGAPALELARFGITPVTVLAASQGVANFARRICDAKDIRHGDLILQTREKIPAPSNLPSIQWGDSVREVELTAELDHDKAGKLYDWMTRAAERVPRFFDGFEAAPWGRDELRLRRTDVVEDDLFRRWRSMP